MSKGRLLFIKIILVLMIGAIVFRLYGMQVINGEGYSFPVYFDKDMTASESYQAYSIPVTYFIDADGNIVYNSIGAMSEYALSEGIKMIHDDK